ncbi:MAG: hypothetical protein OXH00_21740 [Candidatus Poribacteria bacterium]|nr:hypothetical protein [Candidatus Poribacteria bacterium]
MSKEEQRLETYTPTRLEWLCVYLNSLLPSTILQINGFHSMFMIDNAQKDIELHIRHYSHMDEDFINDYVENAKGLATSIIDSYEWDSYIKVDVRITKIDREKQYEKDYSPDE